MRNLRIGDSKQHTVSDILLTILLLASLVASCAVVKKSHPPKEPHIFWEGKTPAQVLAYLRENKEEITDLTAAFSVSVDPPLQGQPSHMHGVVFFARKSDGPYVRIKGHGLFGRLLFDLVHKGNEIRIYVPSQHTLFQGLRSQGKGPDNAWGDLLKTMFSDFSGTGVSGSAALSFNDAMVIVPLEEGEIRIERNSGLVRQWHHRNQIITYDRYDQKPGLPPIPTHVVASAADGSRRAVCRLSQVTVNSNLADVFDLSDYNPKIIRDLNEFDITLSP